MSLKIEESLELFTKKCAKLDLPPDCYPDLQYLKKIFRQNLSFFELFAQKVDTKYAVDVIRKNILVAHMKNPIQGSKTSKIHESLPKEFKNYIRYNQFLEKKKELKEKQYYLKTEEKQKIETFEKNEVKIIKGKESARLSGGKLDLLQAKLISINKSIDEEEELKRKIKDVTPAKFVSSNNLDYFCSNINQCIQILKEFSEKNDNSYMMKKKIWKKVEELMKCIPNSVIFQMIMTQLSTKIENSFLSVNIQTKTQPKKISEKLLPPLYQLKIISGIEMLSQRKKLEDSKRVCGEVIQSFENELDSLLNASIDYSFQLEDDDIVAEFLSVLIAKVNLEAKVKFCADVVSEMKQHVETNFEYEQLVNETRTIHGFIDEKMADVQEHVQLIHQINEKINFNKISVMRMIQSLKMEKSQQHNRTLLNQTLNNTVITTKECEVSLPKHEFELQQFLDLPIHKFDRDISMNGLLLLSDEKIIYDMVKINGHLANNPHHFLNDLEKCFKFGNHIKSILNEITSHNHTMLTEVNYDNLLKQRDENSKEISTMIDEISKLNVAIKVNLNTINSLYKFALENPLRKFIPKTKKVDGKPYEYYEKEYMLYYQMIKN